MAKAGVALTQHVLDALPLGNLLLQALGVALHLEIQAAVLVDAARLRRQDRKQPLILVGEARCVGLSIRRNHPWERAVDRIGTIRPQCTGG